MSNIKVIQSFFILNKDTSTHTVTATYKDHKGVESTVVKEVAPGAEVFFDEQVYLVHPEDPSKDLTYIRSIPKVVVTEKKADGSEGQTAQISEYAIYRPTKKHHLYITKDQVLVVTDKKN